MQGSGIYLLAASSLINFGTIGGAPLSPLDDDAVNVDGGEVVNYGTILSGGTYTKIGMWNFGVGVYARSGASIINGGSGAAPSALISGAIAGIHFIGGGSGDEVINFGTIRGRDGIEIQSVQPAAIVTNFGTIIGTAGTGTSLDLVNGSGTIANFGTVIGSTGVVSLSAGRGNADLCAGPERRSPRRAGVGRAVRALRWLDRTRFDR